MKVFTQDDNQEAKVEKWQRCHPCPFRDTKTGLRQSATFGDMDTYSFVPTSVGMLVLVKCACGAEIDVSHPL